MAAHTRRIVDNMGHFRRQSSGSRRLDVGSRLYEMARASLQERVSVAEKAKAQAEADKDWVSGSGVAVGKADARGCWGRVCPQAHHNDIIRCNELDSRALPCPSSCAPSARTATPGRRACASGWWGGPGRWSRTCPPPGSTWTRGCRSAEPARPCAATSRGPRSSAPPSSRCRSVLGVHL
jgi:hypothetical protein